MNRLNNNSQKSFIFTLVTDLLENMFFTYWIIYISIFTDIWNFY